MTNLPATMQNAYLARGIHFPAIGDNPAYAMAALFELAGHTVDPIKIAELAAWYDEPVESDPREWKSRKPAGRIIRVYRIRCGDQDLRVPREAIE